MSLMGIGLIIEITANGTYIARTEDYAVHESFDNKFEAFGFASLYFQEVECGMIGCENCDDMTCPKNPKNKKPPKSGRISTKNK